MDSIFFLQLYSETPVMKVLTYQIIMHARTHTHTRTHTGVSEINAWKLIYTVIWYRAVDKSQL